ncbi:MAG: TIGR03619 family F420-dependent LLM class oxidoreductase [Acidimicrobiales bacterium]
MSVRFTLPFPMFPANQLVPLAQVAEEAGFDAVAVPDSVFFPETVSEDYPYSEDGARFWSAETPFVDPFVAVSAMTAVTTRLRFYTNVVKLPIRNPLLVAKQVASIAALSDDRFALGVGLAWIDEEFVWTGTTKRTRGARTDEAIEIIRAVCAGGGPRWVEHHGQHYDFDRLMISPAPSEPVPIYVGGHSDAALQRAARSADGWISVQSTAEELAVPLDRLWELREDFGRSHLPFVTSCLALDVDDVDGYKRLVDLGVTDIQVVPWYFDGGDPEALETKRASILRFADDVMPHVTG